MNQSLLNILSYQNCSQYHVDSALTFTGKERDEETGYGYFGARYMDHELMTMWLSVDPMSDKYPLLSPYNYCDWNPVNLNDENGEFPTQKKVQKARDRAVQCFGDDRVGEIRNLGTLSNPNYGFAVYGKGKDKYTSISYSSENGLSVIAYRPDEIVTSGLGLVRSRLKHRCYQLDISCSVGAQAKVDVTGVCGLDVNLCSAEVFNFSLGTEGCAFSTIKDNNANCTSSLGIGLGGVNVSGGVEYRGGEYIDKDSVKPFGSIGISFVRNTNEARINSLGADIKGSKDKVGIGVSAACIFGIRISFSSKTQ